MAISSRIAANKQHLCQSDFFLKTILEIWGCSLSKSATHTEVFNVHLITGTDQNLSKIVDSLLTERKNIQARSSHCWLDIIKHFMTGLLGNSEISFLRISMFPQMKQRETWRFTGSKISVFPWDQSLSNLLTVKQTEHFDKMIKPKANFEKCSKIPATTSGHLHLHCNSSQHELANEWAHSSGKIASNVTKYISAWKKTLSSKSKKCHSSLIPALTC